MDRIPPGPPRLHDGHLSHRNAPHPAPAPLPAFLPPTAQPPVQIPFSDPFHNRDPFLPSGQHSRKSSYGTLDGAAPPAPFVPYAAERAWSTAQGQQPPHVHMQPLAGPGHAPNGHSSNSLMFDDARRRSVGAAGSPPRYAGGPLDPPPPPSFASRNMPPPSPSSNPSSSFAGQVSRVPPSFPISRELPGLSTRPGGGLSISSLIGGGESTGRTEQSPRAATAHNSPTFRRFSPPRARSTSVRSEFGHMQRPLSPRQRDYPPPFDGRSAPVNSSRPFVPQPHSLPQAAIPNAGNHMFRPYQSSPTSTPGDIAHANNPPPRPTSQPSNIQHDQIEAWRRAPPEEGRFVGFRNYDERAAGASPGLPATNGTNGSVRHPDTYRKAPSPGYTQRSEFAMQGRAATTPSREDLGGSFRPTSHPHAVDPSASGPTSFRDASGFATHGARERLVGQPSPPPQDGFEHRMRFYGPHPQHEREERYYAEHGMRRDGDEGPASHKSLLAVSPELNRTNGRGSPLPQAVQGAQPRLMGPGRDPSIKNEFGRMFSGLGSGFGGSGTPVGGYSANGMMTPSRLSPSRFGDHGEGAEADTGLFEGPDSARGTQKGRRTRDDSVKEDGESMDGRNTPTAMQKGSKRAKTGHAAHHHHHHPHTHHHHHHHHNVPDSEANTGSFSTLRFPANANQAQPSATHHHHHHHATHGRGTHHHHHTHRATSPDQPQVVITDQSVMQSVVEKPRAHLGSMLYTTRLSIPSNKHSSLDTKFAFNSTQIPLPRFDGKENSTFTIRVPRNYLAYSEDTAAMVEQLAGGLEEICKRRSLWGTGIYTDDSDVVAAAVHSGWIRGDFGEYNQDLRDLFDIETQTKEGHPRLILHDKPARPMTIPTGYDAHITVLLLPTLERYASSTMNFIRSRSWRDSHDGMSFKIHSIEFVDEPRFTRYSERGPEARRQRMKEDIQNRNEAAESLLGLRQGGTPVQTVNA